MSGEKTREKERMFCEFYAQTRNVREAAVRAGYVIAPEKTGIKLLAQEAIRKEIQKISDSHTPQGEAAAGLRRLAFGNVTDAVRLLYADRADVEKELGNFDLFNVSEIKFSKTGVAEIKFFDRIKALEKLMQALPGQGEKGALPFYRALEQSAQNVGRLLEDERDGD